MGFGGIHDDTADKDADCVGLHDVNVTWRCNWDDGGRYTVQLR